MRDLELVDLCLLRLAVGGAWSLFAWGAAQVVRRSKINVVLGWADEASLGLLTSTRSAIQSGDGLKRHETDKEEREDKHDAENGRDYPEAEPPPLVLDDDACGESQSATSPQLVKTHH